MDGSVGGLVIEQGRHQGAREDGLRADHWPSHEVTIVRMLGGYCVASQAVYWRVGQMGQRMVEWSSFENLGQEQEHLIGETRSYSRRKTTGGPRTGNGVGNV